MQMAQLDPENSNHWQIKRGSKTYSVKSKQLLLKIRDEGRFSPSDLIREYPDGTWKTFAEFDLNATQVIAPPQSIAAPSVSEDKIAAGKIADDTAPSYVGWWRQSEIPKTAKHENERRNTKRRRLVLGVALLSAMILASFVWIPRRNAIGLTQINNKSGIPISSSVDPSTHSDKSTAATDDWDEFRVATPKTENAAQIDSVDLRQTETDSSPQIPLNAPQSVDQENSDDLATVIDLDASDMKPAQNKSETRAKGDLAPAEKNVLLLGERQSASQIELEKEEIDHIYDSIMAAIQSSRSLQSSILTYRSDIISSNRRIADLEAGIASTNLQLQQAISLYAKAEAELVEKRFLSLQLSNSTEPSVATDILRQQLNNKIEMLKNQMVVLTGNVQTCRSEIANQSRKLEVELNSRVTLQKKLDQDFAKERSQLSDEFLAVDFFGDIPISIHEKLFRESSNWILAEPDFFFAYLVNSASAIQLEKLDLPQKNLQQLREQIALLSAWETENRRACLTQFEIIALAANGLSKMKKGDFSSAEIQIRDAFRLNEPTAELRFAAAAIAMEQKKNVEAINQIRNGLKLASSSPRAYAIALQILNRNTETSKKILSSNLSKFETRIDRSTTRQWPHHRYWLIAAETAYRTGESEKASEFLQLAEHPFLQEQINQLSKNLSGKLKDSND
jgi:hypothetical protein